MSEGGVPATSAAPGPEPDPEAARAHRERVDRARSRLTGLKLDDEKVAKAQKRLQKAEAERAQTRKEADRLKWLFIPMLTTWPLGFLWHGWVALYIFLAWVTVWGVGRYLSWGHSRNAENRVLEAQAEIQALHELRQEAARLGGESARASQKADRHDDRKAS